MKNFICYILVLMISYISHSQTFTKSTATYSDLTGDTYLTDTTVWSGTSNIPAADKGWPLGFKFRAFDWLIDSFYFFDGGLTLETATSSYYLFIGMEDNMMDRGYLKWKRISDISYKKSGSAGSRMMQIQWKNYGFYGEYSNTNTLKDSGNVQLWIYETGKAELRFGPHKITSFSNNFPYGVPIHAYINKSGSYFGKSLSGGASSPTSSDYNSLISMSSYPANGTVYTFDFTNTNGIENLTKSSEVWFSENNLCLSPNSNISQIEISDLNGKTIMKVKSPESRTDLAYLPCGVYVAIIESNGKYERLKFLIQ